MSTDTSPDVVTQDGAIVEPQAVAVAGPSIGDRLASLAALTVLKDELEAAWKAARAEVKEALIADREVNGSVKTRNVEIGGTKVGQVTVKDLSDTVVGADSPAFQEWVEEHHGEDKIEYKASVRKSFWDGLLATLTITEDGEVVTADGEVVPGLSVIRAPKVHGEFGLTFSSTKIGKTTHPTGRQAALAAILGLDLHDLSTAAITDGLKK